MLAMGILSILQVGFLPGFLLLRVLRLTDGKLKTFILSFSISLVINHFIVVIFTYFNFYTRPSLLAVLMFEAACLAYLNKQNLNTTIKFRLNTTEAKSIFSNLQYNRNHLLSYLLAFSSIAYFCYNAMTNIGEVLHGWDAVASWNRWAVDWYHGIFPRLTYNYPQLVPTVWSMTYIFIGTHRIQFFVTAIIPLFPLLTLLIFYDLGKRRNEISFIYGIPVLALSYLALLLPFLNEGYVDIPVAFMGLSSIYAILCAQGQEHKKYLYIGLLCCAGAALTKQAGLYLLAIYPIICCHLIRPPSAFNKKQFMIMLFSYALLLSLVMPWYLYSNYKIRNGLDESEIRHVTSEIHKGADLTTRYLNSIATITTSAKKNINNIFPLPTPMPAVTTGLFVLVYFLICGLHAKLSRIFLLGFVIPFYLIWSLFFSYDVRNISIILPAIALVAGHGISLNLNIIGNILLRNLGVRQ